jgi:hypothetical protein
VDYAVALFIAFRVSRARTALIQSKLLHSNHSPDVNSQPSNSYHDTQRSTNGLI